jgi:hypothetical protein
MLKPARDRAVRAQKLTLKRHFHRVRRFESPVPALEQGLSTPEQGGRVPLRSVFAEIRSVQEYFYDGQRLVRPVQKLVRSVQTLVRSAQKLASPVQKLVRSAQKGFEAENRPVRKALVNGYNRRNIGGNARTSGVLRSNGGKIGPVRTAVLRGKSFASRQIAWKSHAEGLTETGKNFASRPLADERQSFNLLKTVVEEVNDCCGRFGRCADYDAGNGANKRHILRPIVRQSGDVRNKRGGNLRGGPRCVGGQAPRFAASRKNAPLICGLTYNR